MHSNYNPNTSYGGIELVVSQLLKAIASKDIDLCCFCGGNESKIFLSQNVKYISRKIIFKLRGAPILSFGNYFLIRLGLKSDVVIFQEPFPFLWPAIKFIKLFSKVHVIVLIHADPAGSRLIKYIYRNLRKFVFTNCTCVATSPQVKSKINTRFFNISEVIPLYVERSKKEINKIINYDLPEKYVLYIGRISSYKGIEILLEAAIMNSDINFVIAGSGPLSKLVRDAVPKAANKNIIFIDKFISEYEKQMLIRESLFLVFPSTNENEAFGLVQLEAMREGKPLVNTNLGTGVNFVAPHMVCALTVPPSNALLLSQAIRTLWSNSDLVFSLGKSGRNRCNELFTSEGFTMSWRRLLRSLLR